MKSSKENKMKKLLFLTVVLLFTFPVAAHTEGSYQYKNRADFDRIFDEVSRNFGAVEASYYTYTMEFERVPQSLQDMIDTGHLRVKWTNPYTGETVKQTYDREIGDISWEVLDNGEYIAMTTFFISWNNMDETRWMKRGIWPYTQEELKKWVFNNDVTREEQLVRVYCLQLEDALESYELRFGYMPESYEDLAKADVNVAYINPITGEVVKNSPELSPGDFWYEKIVAYVNLATGEVVKGSPEFNPGGKWVDASLFSIVGWGLNEPVYFMSNDRTREEFEWNDKTVDNTEQM
jgi:hypothetical protein